MSRSILKKKKQKFQPLFCEGAQIDLLVTLLPGRHPCQCLATKHKLINNCTQCGRIVCEQEGSGPCYFCGSLVATQIELDQIILGTKQSIKLRNKLTHLGWESGIQAPYQIKRGLKKKLEKQLDSQNLEDLVTKVDQKLIDEENICEMSEFALSTNEPIEQGK